MQLSIMDLVSILEISLIMLASGFAFLLPLYIYLKNFKLALELSIPVSISIEILTGYLFYTFGLIRIFPLVYLLFALTINFVIAYRTKLIKKIKRVRLRANWKTIIPIILLIVSIILPRFYDAARNIAPGAIDAAAHALYVIDLNLYGKLGFASYPPGFHILVFPLSQIIGIVDIYRFTGPVIGVITMISLYLLLRDRFKNRYLPYFLILTFGLPVFSVLTLQTISFYPTALTFIFLPALVFALTRPEDFSDKKILLFYAIVTSALAITVPYLLVQLIPAIGFLLLIASLSKKALPEGYPAFIFKAFTISLCGFLLAFGLVYLQNTISDRTDVGNFPQITIAESQGSDLDITTNTEKSASFLERHRWLENIIGNNKIIKNYLLPMIMTGSDIILPKDIRSLGNATSLGAYFCILASLLLIYLGIKKKMPGFLVLGCLIVIFGLATQTGILEMSTYRGRSGWYLLLLTPIALVYFFDTYLKKIPITLVRVTLILLILAPVINPLTFYRGYFTEYFTEAENISRQFPNQKILIITAERRAIAVSENFTYRQLDPDLIEDVCQFDQCFIMLENKYFEVDPVLSQKSIATDRDLKKFKAEQAELKKYHNSVVDAVKNSKNFSKYKMYWENENLSIYKFEF